MIRAGKGESQQYRAKVLPEDKIAIVNVCPSQAHTVVLVGNRVNDALALAQSDVGIATGATGTDVASAVAHVALMREGWLLVPAIRRIARRTLRFPKLNIGFTAAYQLDNCHGHAGISPRSSLSSRTLHGCWATAGVGMWHMPWRLPLWTRQFGDALIQVFGVGNGLIHGQPGRLVQPHVDQHTTARKGDDCDMARAIR